MQGELARSTVAIALATALALLVGVLAAWLITRAVVGPLKRVIARAQRIAAGDLVVEAETTRRDEVGQLTLAMQQMAAGLAGIVSGLQQGIEQLAGNAQALSAVTEQTNREVGSQKEETEQVATAMQQMTATVHDVARNAEEAAQAAQSADDKVESGQQVVRQSMQRIEQLAAAAETASAGIDSERRNPYHWRRTGSDQERRRADQPAGAQRGDRGCPGRRTGTRFCRGGR